MSGLFKFLVGSFLEPAGLSVSMSVGFCSKRTFEVVYPIWVMLLLEFVALMPLVLSFCSTEELR